MQWFADRIKWFADRIADYNALTTDQKIAFWGVLITATAALFSLVAIKYARDAVREARSALVVARNASREQRSARRLEQLQRLSGPVLSVKNAAATAEAQPAVGAEALRDAREVLTGWLEPFSDTELPNCFRAARPELDAKDANAAAAAGQKELKAGIDAERKHLQTFGSEATN